MIVGTLELMGRKKTFCIRGWYALLANLLLWMTFKYSFDLYANGGNSIPYKLDLDGPARCLYWLFINGEFVGCAWLHGFPAGLMNFCR